MNRYRLPVDYLDTMLAAYRELPYKEAASLTIGFLIGADESDYFENNVISAFTALETLVSAISEHEGTALLLSDEAFRELRKDLTKRIEEHPVGAALTSAQRAALCAKLPEIKRSPIVGRIVELIERHGIQWSDLWPRKANLEAELRQAYHRRSVLIHSGSILDAQKSQADRLRVQTLAERLLYKLLGGGQDWLDPRAERHVSWLGKQ